MQVRDHSFADRDGGHAIPYGIYDVAANTGFVNVGTGGNTAALAVESIRRWWQLAGRDAYPAAGRLLVTCDAGGSNGWKNRAWKAGLAELARETGLAITVCHFPPGTSKWNKIEHRLFSQITLGWRGRPLTSYDVIINTISAVTTRTGLTVTAVLDGNPCPTGTRISDQQAKDIEDRHLTRHGFHGEWNYTVLPVPRPAPDPDPEPEPPPARPGRCSSDLLNHPALTGLDPADLTALAAALEIPFRARREQRRYLRHGRARQLAEGASGGGSNRKLDLTDHLLATRMRQHLNLPPTVTGALLGAHGTTISHATSLTASLLAGQPQPPAAPPPGIRLRTLADLRDYAAGHGITIPAGIGGHTPPADSTLQAPDTPQTQLNLEYLPGNDDGASLWPAPGAKGAARTGHQPTTPARHSKKPHPCSIEPVPSPGGWSGGAGGLLVRSGVLVLPRRARETGRASRKASNPSDRATGSLPTRLDPKTCERKRQVMSEIILTGWDILDEARAMLRTAVAGVPADGWAAAEPVREVDRHPGPAARRAGPAGVGCRGDGYRDTG